MKKVLPVLFVLSTAIITIAGFALSSKGVFKQLKADENSHTYTQTFNAGKITSYSKRYDTVEFAFKTTTAGGSDFGCHGNAVARSDSFSAQSNSYMVKGDYWGDDYGYISMTFVFKNVLAPVSVVLNGEFYDEREFKSTSLTFTQVSTVSGYPAISFTTDNLTDFELDSVVVQYTCSY